MMLDDSFRIMSHAGDDEWLRAGGELDGQNFVVMSDVALARCLDSCRRPNSPPAATYENSGAPMAPMRRAPPRVLNPRCDV